MSGDIGVIPHPAARGSAVTKRCQLHVWRTGERCTAAATWTVQVGTRRSDAQDSCERHLSLTCWAMLQGENRPLTVMRVAS